MTDTSCSDSDVSKNGKDGLAAGSRAFLNDLPSEAVQNFKVVLEKTSCKSNQKIPLSQLVLRYALCLALIKCNDYNHVAEAVTILLELIDSGYANKLPSLYLALGKAYFALNRFKSALDFIDKGLKAIQATSKIKQHMWPGLQQTIDETVKENLHKELIKLQKSCKQSHNPTAVCRFEKCIENSTHLIPSQDIYLTDPDFKPFLYIQCNSNCKYAYHDSCWKHLKRIDLNLDEPKDLLGTSCSACSSKIKNDSVIVEVNLIGSEFGFDKPLFTWLLEEDKCPTIKLRNQVKSNTTSPYKGNSKPVSSNGSLTKSCVSNTGLRTSEVHNISMSRTNPAHPAYVYQPLPQMMSRLPNPNVSFPYPIHQAGFNFVPGIEIHGPRPIYYFPPAPAQWAPWPRGGAPYLSVNNNSYQQPPLQQPPTCVEVVVSNTQVLKGGTTLIVPVTPTGGPCKIVRPPLVESQIQTPHPKCNNTEECEDLPEESPTAAIESVVDQFKSVVWKLGGKSPSTHDTSPNSDKSSKVNIKSVVEEFKKLVHSLAGEDVNKDVKKETFSMALAPQCQDTHPSFPSSTLDQLLISEASTLQAKVSPTEDENSSEQSSLYSSLDDVRSESQDSTKLAYLLDILHQCRKLDFGYLPSENMNPELQCFGHPYVDSPNFVEPNEIDESDKDQADFVFSYYYSVFERNGLHRLEDIQEKWRTTITEDLELPEFTNKYSSVSEFLLKSQKFAAIDEFIGTSDLLPDMFSKAQVEIAESVSFLLFSQDPNTNSVDEHHSADTFNDTWKIKMNNNNNNNNAHTHHNLQSSASADDSCSDHSDDCEKSEHVALSKDSNDNNDNPISMSPATFNFNKLIVAHEVNGMPTSTSGCNASSMADVYMSDEDEEIDSSLVIDGVVKDVPLEWSEAKSKPDVLHKHSQTDHIVDAEKENLVKSKDSLLKEVSELRYEKGELHQRIESLQIQMETNRATMESLYESTLKQTQEKHDEELLEKSSELKEIRDKYCALEQTVIELQHKNEAKENEVSKLTSSLQKIQRNHAKEMNNFEQRLEERMKHKLAESINQSKRYIQLWKDFCEFKINKYNQTCNDRINVLSQLKDMVSDSGHPFKAELLTMIETYEDSMISVTQKNAEVNDIFIKQMDRMKGNLEVQLPAVVDVPDLTNIPYPPEGVFEHLQTVIKPKQDDFSVPQNHFLGGSRFYPPRTYNGLQSRENEGFAPGSSSSLFGQGHNETNHLWNSTLTPAFESGNSQYHQGFGSSNPIMQQSSMSLMAPLMYQSSTQNPMLAQRTTASPSLSLSSVNGSAFNSNSSNSGLSTALGSLAAPGSKIPPLGPLSQNLRGNPTPMISQPVKTTASPVPSAPAPVSPPQGAIPKPRVQTATASMTPIVPSKPKPTLKGARTHESNYEKLMRNLQKMFPTRTDMELTQALKIARERNNNSLSSLSHSEIVSRVEEILNTFRKQTSMSWEKFGQAAWGTAKTPVIEWEGQEQDECCICMAPMQAREVYTLECKHAFHKDCIKKWLEQESVCPNCRTHSTMVDEFPPLG